MINKRIAVIGIPGKWSTEVLANHLEQRTGYRCVIDMADVVLELETGELRYRDTLLNTLDGVIIKKISETYSPAADDRLRMLKTLEADGVRCFSSPSQVGRLINRLEGTAALASGGIPLPATRVTESTDAALEAIQTFGKVILKPLYSTKARGMVVLKAADGVKANTQILNKFKAKHGLFYLQKFVNLGGQDLGMVFLGGKYLCTYARVGDDKSWNTTIHSGGKYRTFDASPELIELGLKAQSCFDLSFTTVDIALTDEGPVVFEVSAFGGFSGAKKGCGIDAAEKLCDYVLSQLEAETAETETAEAGE
ncbi:MULTISPECIES: GAK system ATP-grasp enzyme [Halomonadaceae]|uniref:GAK system ATP-grasp enzyme n=1 Tax=Halomonadaceae TaxID=28256 RepID=UPI0012EF4D3F|nr:MULTISPECIES: GAK system ATP-grasp enzyme [Halomonas]UEQ05777.1 GAK system ATP-grasp enzyme [Halomonas profundus]CAD5264364.1 ATP-grasp fold, RimK-type [Halomonas sp. 156]CAD5265536.1 ATP-grasp fold, RimK-type [Halomonas sp. I3]CAD5284262.1 ATP-grasp fold, RimK-type [Halomonas sp. 113]CAD5285740.1 ATP-grasp fold, RimK-type [Halomonas sp. 59]